MDYDLSGFYEAVRKYYDDPWIEKKHRHAWFTEQQTGHTWCPLCGKHKRKRDDLECKP